MEIETVIVGGRAVDRTALDMMLAKARQLVEANEALKIGQARFVTQAEMKVSEASKLDLFYQQWSNGSERFITSDSADGRTVEAVIETAGWDSPKRAILNWNRPDGIDMIRCESLTKVPKRYQMARQEETWSVESGIGSDRTGIEIKREPRDLINSCWIHLGEQVRNLGIDIGLQAPARLIEWDWSEMVPVVQLVQLKRLPDRSVQLAGSEEQLQVYELTDFDEPKRLIKLAIDRKGHLIQASKVAGAETRKAVLSLPE
jgi:hypothetical protein